FLPTANRYPCGDGKWVVFNMPETRYWPMFCKAIEKPEWLEDERLIDVRSRFRLMNELVPLIDEALAAKTRDEWGKIFDQAGLIWGPVLALHEVAADAQAEAINLFPELNHEALGPYRTVNIPMRFANTEVKPRHRAPTLGENTRATLKAAGFDDKTLDQLAEKGVINR
ncbi:MAG: crotonobetainyl-CoA:carnitine CoA-transferase CaiB-like acyl-CoA transferase, partial [Planctomycetaceae bacterium]